jgi:hypothetical protein
MLPRSSGDRFPGGFPWGALLIALLAVPLDAAYPTQTIASPVRTFTGPDGNPLPFRNDAEVLDFLSTASVVEETTIGTGINRSQKVLLERDGVRAHAIFRESDDTDRDIRVGDESYRLFRDSYLFEPAAYHLALRLGITNIPPAVRRRIDSRDGSMQIWIEDTLDEETDGFKPPSISAWIRQLRDMILFDNFIYNVDRNGGNILVTPDYELVMIDHTRGFQEKNDIMDPGRFNLVNEDTWEIFQNLTDDAIRDAVRPYLSPQEMNPLLRRHEAIIQYVEGLIAERGRAAVVIP